MDIFYGKTLMHSLTAIRLKILLRYLMKIISYLIIVISVCLAPTLAAQTNYSWFYFKGANYIYHNTDSSSQEIHHDKPIHVWVQPDYTLVQQPKQYLHIDNHTGLTSTYTPADNRHNALHLNKAYYLNLWHQNKSYLLHTSSGKLLALPMQYQQVADIDTHATFIGQRNDTFQFIDATTFRSAHQYTQVQQCQLIIIKQGQQQKLMLALYGNDIVYITNTQGALLHQLKHKNPNPESILKFVARKYNAPASLYLQEEPMTIEDAPPLNWILFDQDAAWSYYKNNFNAAIIRINRAYRVARFPSDAAAHFVAIYKDVENDAGADPIAIFQLDPNSSTVHCPVGILDVLEFRYDKGK